MPQISKLNGNINNIKSDKTDNVFTDRDWRSSTHFPINGLVASQIHCCQLKLLVVMLVLVVVVVLVVLVLVLVVVVFSGVAPKAVKV